MKRGVPQKTVMVIDNLDDILSQRSQISGSEAGGSFNDLTLTRRTSRATPLGHVAARRSRAAISSEDEDDYGGQIGLVNPQKLVRRHSALAQPDSLVESDSSSSSRISSPLSEPLSRRRRIDVPVTRRSAPIGGDLSEDDDLRPSIGPVNGRGGGLLKCLACFKFSNNNTSAILSRTSQASEDLPFQDPACASIDKLFRSLSEETEIDTTIASDKRSVFLLFSALSGEPLLAPAEYPECDEWIDWLSIGFSNSELESFERDINRTGSQSLGFLFQIFFALEFTESARLASLIIRNVHFDPSALFGLFAVNCSKWTRDVVHSALSEFDQSAPGGPPPMVASVRPIATMEKRMFGKFTRFLDWWISRGAWGDLAEVEKPFLDDGTTSSARLYESLQEDSDPLTRPFSSEGEGGSETGKKPPKQPPRGVSGSPRSSTKRPSVIDCRIRCIDANVVEDMISLRQALIVGGIHYTFCMLSFAKFWLQKDLLSVDAEVARERLTNAYLETAFVKKLRVSPLTPIGGMLNNIDRLKARVDQLWKSSGWTSDDLKS